MGGGSSKTKKSKLGGSKYELSHTVDEDVASSVKEGNLNNNLRNKEKDSKSNAKKKNRKSKGSVKIKAEKKSRSKSFRSNDARSNLDPVLVADISEPASQKNPLPNSPVYRKKSSCPSCEAKDLLMGKNRSRSSSEMRFSDFNKVLRKTRIYDWEMVPMDIPLYGVPEPQPDDVCYICGVYTGSHVRTCRVCCRAFHDGCLAKIGHALNERARRLIASDLWSCHQCCALNHLLTQEEVRAVIDDFQDLGISKDNITEDNYLKYCQHSLQQQDRHFNDQKKESSIARFRSIVNPQSDIVTWTNFLNIESVRILNRRCKDSLVHLLTQAEITEARKIFQQLDKDKMGVTTKAAVQALLDSNKTRYSAYYPDDSMMYIDEDLNGSLTWGDFLRDRAIYFLGRRPNVDADGFHHSDSLDDDIGGVTFTASSMESMDDDDDDEYNTCHSELETSLRAVKAKNSSSNNQNNTKASLDDSTEGQMSPLHTSTNMLDEFNSEMDKCCMRHTGASVTVQDNNHPNTTARVDHECGKPLTSSMFLQSSADTMDQRVTANISNETSETAAPELNTSNPKGKDAKDLSSSPEKTKVAPYNNSRHANIPWADLGHHGQPTTGASGKIGHRKSEVIPRRQEQLTTGQVRAVSQIGCRQGRNVLAPAYGNLVGRVNNGEWGC